MSLIAILVLCGIAAFVVKQAPVIAEPYKGFILWILLIFAVCAIFYFFFGPVSFDHFPTRRRG